MELTTEQHKCTGKAMWKIHEVLYPLTLEEKIEVLEQLYWEQKLIPKVPNAPYETECQMCGARITFATAEELEGHETALQKIPAFDGEEYCKSCLTKVTQKTEIAIFEDVKKMLRGFPYRAYLQSEHWNALRKEAYKRAGYKCVLCDKRENLNAHHKRYDNLGDITIIGWDISEEGNAVAQIGFGSKEINDLIVLCELCHEHHHQID